jgi:cation:H+ antiporter
VLNSLSLPLLVLIFACATAAVWVAGVSLANSVDVLSQRLGFGEAFGGLILLAFVTNLPEIAIVVSASLSDNLGIAIGNILGGIAIQTVVLAILDVWGVRGEPLMYRAASLPLVLEGALVVAILVVVIMGTRISEDVIYGRLTPAVLLIAVFWAAGLWLIGRAELGLPWHDAGHAPGSQPEPAGHAEEKKEAHARRMRSTSAEIGLFAGAALVTLAGGVFLERSGSGIAEDIGLSGVLFGATFLAAATALPEVSTGLTSLKLGDYKLAVSDVFGGNAFLPTLFLVATLISGKAVLPEARSTDIYLTALGALLSTVYIFGLLFRPRREILGMGIDSAVVVGLYILGIAGLIVVEQ